MLDSNPPGRPGIPAIDLPVAELRQCALAAQRIRVDDELSQGTLAGVTRTTGRCHGAARGVARVDDGVEIEAEVDAAHRRAVGRRRDRGEGLRHASVHHRERGPGGAGGVDDGVRQRRILTTDPIGHRHHRIDTALHAIGLHGNAGRAGGSARTRGTHRAIHHAHANLKIVVAGRQRVAAAAVGHRIRDVCVVAGAVEFHRHSGDTGTTGSSLRPAESAAVVGILENDAGKGRGMSGAAHDQRG